MNNSFKGYTLGIIAAATYGLNPLFALPLYERGMNPDSVLLLRYLFAVPIIWIMLKIRGRSLGITRGDIIPLFLMGLLVAFSSLTLFVSYNYMNAGIASTILFVYPVMVAVMMALFYRERISFVTVLCMIASLGGIMLLYKAPDGATLSLVGTVMALLSGLTYAVYIVAANRPRFRSMPTLKMIFYVMAFGVTVFLAGIVFGGSLTLPDDWIGWGCALALAVLPTAVSFSCTTAAIQYIGSTPAAILGALEPVTAILVSILVFGENVTQREIVGLVLIILSVSVVAGGKEVTRRLIRIREMFPKLRQNDH